MKKIPQLYILNANCFAVEFNTVPRGKTVQANIHIPYYTTCNCKQKQECTKVFLPLSFLHL